MQGRLPVLLAALWWGSLTTIGFLVVPLLFINLGNPASAGAMAARLFTAQTWLSLSCSLLLLLASRKRQSVARVDWARGAVVFIVGGVLLALVSQFAVAPRIVARENLKLWHAVGSGMYLLQWVCAATVLWKTAGLRSGGPS